MRRATVRRGLGLSFAIDVDPRISSRPTSIRMELDRRALGPGWTDRCRRRRPRGDRGVAALGGASAGSAGEAGRGSALGGALVDEKVDLSSSGSELGTKTQRHIQLVGGEERVTGRRRRATAPASPSTRSLQAAIFGHARPPHCSDVATERTPQSRFEGRRDVELPAIRERDREASLRATPPRPRAPDRRRRRRTLSPTVEALGCKSASPSTQN